MKLSYNEANWVSLAKNGQLDQAYKEYLLTEGAQWIRTRRFAYFFIRTLGSILLKYLFRKLPKDPDNLAIELAEEYLFFYRDIDTVGYRLFKKIICHIIIKKKAPIRAGIWFAHWLVFQGKYHQAAILFSILNKHVPKSIRIKSEIYTFLGNYFYIRGKLKRAEYYHTECHKICVNFSDTVVRTFNIGQWIRLGVYDGSTDHLIKILSLLDGMSPNIPDERYGLRVLSFAAYIYFLNGEYILSGHFLSSAEKVYRNSSSLLEKAIFHLVRSLISLRKGDLLSGRKSIEDGVYFLKRFGRYYYYQCFFKLLKNMIFSSHALEPTKDVQFYLHKGMVHFLNPSLNPSVFGVEKNLNIDSNPTKWITRFYKDTLKIFENFSSLSGADITEHLRSQIGGTLVDINPDDASLQNNDNYLHITESKSNTVFLFNFYKDGSWVHVRLQAPFLYWRNPDVLDSFKSIVLAVQAISIQEKRKHESRQQEILKQISETATQVAHDIRSPLAALDIFVKSIENLDEDKRLLVKACVNRIRDIANNLLSSHKPKNILLPQETEHSEKTEPILLTSAIDQIVSEKRLQLRSRLNLKIETNIDERAYGVFTVANSTEFKRIISNLLNNAAEAIQDQGQIVLNISRGANVAILTIEDTGCGIPNEAIAMLFTRGYSYKKNSGSGLGLYHAKKMIEKWNGRIEISSSTNIGTKIQISLPVAPVPRWFQSHIDLSKINTVVIIDDEPSIHHIWEERLSPFNLKRVHFASLEEFRVWASSNPDFDNRLHLVDYEFLNQNETGIDLINSLKISSSSVLVTSHFDETEIIQSAERNQVSIIPKSLVGIVPILVLK